MKIKITENQALRLKLLSEEINPLTQFEYLCRVKLGEVNKWYTKISSISIGELLNNEVDMSHINSLLNKIEDEIRSGNRKAYAFIEHEQEEDLDLRIDNAESSVMDKLTVLQLISMDLEKLQISSEEHGFTNRFSDVKPMDISDTQN